MQFNITHWMLFKSEVFLKKIVYCPKHFRLILSPKGEKTVKSWEKHFIEMSYIDI